MNKLPVLIITETEVEIKYIIKGEIIIEVIIIREETLPVKETLTSLGGNKDYNNKDYKFNELISINISITEDEIINNIEFFTNIISY